ncbi:family hydrolase [Paramuricea clavata]|nr:family hydrolase [Paramuricea clavata]
MKIWPGRWIAEEQWPSPNVSTKKFGLSHNGILQEVKDSTVGERNEKTVLIPSSFACGSAGGCMIPGNEPADLAQNQACDDGLSRCWHGDVVDTIDILGSPSVQLEISSDKPVATLCARLVDVFPDGKATLISIGILNLTHRNGHSADEISALKAGEHYNIQLDLDVAGYTVHAGHQLRLALSQSYWPNSIWPPPSTPVLQLHFVSPPVFTLPLRKRGVDINNNDELFNDLGQPVVNPHALSVKEIRTPSLQRYTTHDTQTQSHKTTREMDKGEFQRLDNNTIFGASLIEVYDVVEGEPLSAKVFTETNTRVARKETGTGQTAELFDTFVNTKSVLSADESHFHSECEVKAWCENEMVFENQWKKAIPRFNM